MPSLSFLKKKRTREEKPDPSSSQPASPVTSVMPPNTHSKPFDSTTLVKTSTQSTQGMAATSCAVPQPHPPTIHSTLNHSTMSHPTVNHSREKPASVGGGLQMNPSHHQQVPYGLQPTPSPGQTGTPHNLPSINNLINISQNDGERGEIVNQTTLCS